MDLGSNDVSKPPKPGFTIACGYTYMTKLRQGRIADHSMSDSRTNGNRVWIQLMLPTSLKLDAGEGYRRVGEVRPAAVQASFLQIWYSTP